MTTAARATREVTMHVFRGDGKGGEFHEYRVPLEEGLVVLDVIHRIQGTWTVARLACPADVAVGSGTGRWVVAVIA